MQLSKLFVLIVALFSVCQGEHIIDAKNAKMITFDLFAALVDLTPAMLKQTNEILKDWKDEALVKKFTEAYISQYNQNNMNNAKQSEEESKFHYMMRNGLEYALKQVKKEVSDDTKEKLMHTWCNLDPYEDAYDTLVELKNRGYKIAILSNGDYECLFEEGQHIGKTEQMFDEFFSSQVSLHNPEYEEDQFKTHLHIYEQTWTSKQIDLEKMEVVHVNGGKADGLGAMKYGMNSIWHNRMHQQIEPYEGIVIYNLHSLLNILDPSVDDDSLEQIE